MWKFLTAVAVVVGLIAFGDKAWTLPYIPYFAMSIPAIWIVFLAGLYISQR
ncbi:MAG: hypothetical protein KDJ47_07080 [Hyphomicrobiaceae bacterium]|nr:hypothetical protein [Hyphomicrobiaceae bacterium]